MTPRNRWSVVAALVLVVVAVPVVPRLLPVGDTDVSAAELLDQVRGSAGVGHSGLARTRGTVQLPVGDNLGDVGELVAGTTRLRVWWQDDGAWRVDRLLASGEQDLIHSGPVTVAYDYEDARATVTLDPAIRLPRAPDLLPPALARTTLEDAADAEVARLAPRRVAGIEAPGLRYTPSSGRTTIEQVDVWVDPGSGLALRVEVRASGSGDADVVSEFEDVEIQRPADDLIRFRPSASVDVERASTLDIADAAGRYAPFVLPEELVGFERRTEGEVAAATFGRGVSRFIAVPLRSREADPLRRQLRAAPGVVTGDYRTVATSGALTVLLTGADHGPGAAWLVAGSLSPDTLEAVAQVLLGLPYVEQR